MAIVPARQFMCQIILMPVPSTDQTKDRFPNKHRGFMLIILRTIKEWTMPIQNWNTTLSQLTIYRMVRRHLSDMFNQN